MSNRGGVERTRCKLTNACPVQTKSLPSRELTSQGKIPHDLELEKHPERSMEGRMWLMGDVSALIHVSLLDERSFFRVDGTHQCQDVKPAKRIIDEMMTEAKTQIDNGFGMLSQSRAQL